MKQIIELLSSITLVTKVSGLNVRSSIFEHFYKLPESERIECDSLIKPSETMTQNLKEVKDFFLPAIDDTPENKIKFTALLKVLR